MPYQALHLGSAYGKGDLSEGEAFAKARKIKKEQLLFHRALSSGLCLLTSLFLLCSPFYIAWIFSSAFLENADHDLPSKISMINKYSPSRVLICSPPHERSRMQSIVSYWARVAIRA